MSAQSFPSEHLSNYWSVEAQQLLQELGTTPGGLNTDAAQERLKRSGKNTLEAQTELTPIGLFLNQFKSPIILILLVATLISAFVQDWTDAVIILAIIFGSALLSFVQEYRASNAAARLKAQVNVKAKVLRDGKEQAIPAEEVVPGDIVLLSAGSLIPADGILLEAKDFFVNQAVLTGETFPVEKQPGTVHAEATLSERSNCIFMGTSVRSGSARALIVTTGTQTFFGRTAKRLTLRPPETEFERGIRKLGNLLTEVMLILVIVIFAVNVFFQKPVLDSLLFSIALAVGLTPQLLPAIININLARGARRMAVHGVIVRRLSSIENFGSMDILCTDKTGTLTEGVVRLDHACDFHGQDSEEVKRQAWLNAYFQTGISNPLDEAILASVQSTVQGAEKVDEIPYDFVRKRLSVVVQEQGTRTLICKGALENVLSICTHALIDDAVQGLTSDHLAEIQSRYTQWSAQGYRVLGVASRVVEVKPAYSQDDERELCFAGFLLFFDPPKAGIKETIARLHGLGIHLKIITGDNKLVAAHIAESIGFESAKILTGREMDQLSDEALWHVAEQTDIFAQVDPNQKERIILALKKMGHVVGYMGDGINDAPSLHSADVGISVENAVDVAKDAADFVLLKQDLDVLDEGVREGRRTFANTLKYVFMAVSANFGNMFSVAGASLFLPFLPLLPKQILLINFLTDFPEMTIASDNVDNLYIERPHRWDVDFIRRFMLIFGPLSSVFDYLTFALLLWFLKASEAQFQTGWFFESVLSAMFVVFAVRTRLPFFRSHPSLLMIGTTLVSAFVTVALPYSPLGKVLGFTPLPIFYMLMLLVIVLVYFVSAELTKRWFYRAIENRE
ncbi:MAG TPA: magnesium-translocating P-type ATPase [Anaerolinea thermolimosa]|uniref:Magnesium-transporting ATPase, P-type 1 n=1 Tax=Anaerolinea thermolimosa TaxID=229919 RepID=A0A3D1JJC7_9CHLR|nr:magnesium-translocating P-type ATPase [Anaerolinea thermolimosa]GAP08619.1 magnesium-translocating P-type ATPase [Anaerolinea thermolimosa]HCE17726.1 magnesium-translocating P-type ATPase [Anaerolinea thermolimosa]